MGKSRKRRHVDRNAHRAPGSAPRGQLVERQTPAKNPPLAVISAFPFPVVDEPLVLFRKPPATPPDFRSRYPAKKTRRHKRVPPTVQLVQQLPGAVVHQAAAPSRDAPVLLLTYQPAPSRHLWFADEPLPVCDTLDLLEPALWADEVNLRAPRPAPADVAVPTPEQQIAAATPLPRAAAIAAWKKSGPLDIIGRWLRTRARSLVLQIAPKRPRRGVELARLRAENDYLRQQLRALERLQA